MGELRCSRSLELCFSLHASLLLQAPTGREIWNEFSPASRSDCGRKRQGKSVAKSLWAKMYQRNLQQNIELALKEYLPTLMRMETLCKPFLSSAHRCSTF